jgi:hypothetical protein
VIIGSKNSEITLGIKNIDSMKETKENRVNIVYYLSEDPSNQVNSKKKN